MEIKNVKVNDGKTLAQATEKRGKTLSQSCKQASSNNTNKESKKK